MEGINSLVSENITTAKGFGVIYLITFVPAWVVVFMIGREVALQRSAKDPHSSKARLRSLIALEIAILAAPYIYAVTVVQRVPFLVKGLLFLLLILVLVRIYKKEGQKHQDVF